MKLNLPITTSNRVTLNLIGVTLFLLVWEGVAKLLHRYSVLAPPPHIIPAAFLSEIRSGQWVFALQSSMTHYIIGLTVGTVLGVATGAIAARIPLVEAMISGVARILRPIPPLAWIPFAILWFGISRTAAAFIIATGVFWIVYIATYSSIRNVDPKYEELFRSVGRNGFFDTLISLYLPAASPGISSGVRTAISQGWMMVVAAELFGVAGLGERMWSASGLLATDVVIVYMATIAGIYSLLDLLYCKMEVRILVWTPKEKR